MRLRLGEIANSSKHTRKENITNELIIESSNRMRKPPAVLVEGLANLPKVLSQEIVIFNPSEHEDIIYNVHKS